MIVDVSRNGAPSHPDLTFHFHLVLNALRDRRLIVFRDLSRMLCYYGRLVTGRAGEK